MTELVPRQHVFRVGWQHSKWIVVLPLGVEVSGEISESLPAIKKAMRDKYGPQAIGPFDHVEYLGKG